MFEAVIKYWQKVGELQILENNLHSIIIALGIILFGVFLNKILAHVLSRLLFQIIKKTSQNIPAKEFIKLVKSPFELIFFLVLLYISSSFIDFPSKWHLEGETKFGLKLIIKSLYEIVVYIAILLLVYRLVDFFSLVIKKRSMEDQNKLQEQLVPFLRQILKLIGTIIVIFIVLGTVFNLNVSAIIAGLGIGGVAVALAAKETLENLLASFSIFIDKPFIIGDLIKSGSIVGNVESVGFRTSKIRTLDKSLITIPNRQLVDQPLENLSFRDSHRTRMVIGVPYSTSEEILKAIVDRIKNEILNTSDTNKKEPIVFFEGFGTYTLEIVVIYYASAVQFEDYWKLKEQINYKIMQIIDGSGAEFEYPTSIVHLKNIDK